MNNQAHIARQIAQLLTEPHRAWQKNEPTIDMAQWSAILCAARALNLDSALAVRLMMAGGADHLPGALIERLETLIASHQVHQQKSLWEVESARRALVDYPGRVVLLKGSAYAAGGLAAGLGRNIGDLDILVAKADLPIIEQSLLQSGWQWLKPDDYDDHYYRQWMHELPPLVHQERGKLIDVHHNILPLTARRTPDADALIKAANPLGNGLYILAPADMLLHSIAHLLADGEMAGSMRNLWDIDRLIREYSEDKGDFQPGNFWDRLERRAALHQLSSPMSLALRLARQLYQTPVPDRLAGKARCYDRLFLRRILAVNGYGQQIHPLLRGAFYLRGHFLRMPPHMLARHLYTKWRNNRRAR